MAYKYHDLPRELGRIMFKDKEYSVITINKYLDGKQIIELLDLTNGDKLNMTFKPNEESNFVWIKPSFHHITGGVKCKQEELPEKS